MTMEKKKLPKTSKTPEELEESKALRTPKTPKPRKPKAPVGDQINIENQGERNVIAAGRNARATAFNLNIRDFKWQPVVIVLVVVGALLAAILWYVVPKQAKEMTGQFNVAVAEFTVQDANGRTLRGKDGSLLAAYVAEQIGAQFTEIQLNKSVPYEVWGPDQTGVIAGDTPEERSSNAAALAEKIRAHVLIYGTMVSDGDRSRFMPEFYVNHASFRDASEITGDHEIGSEVKLSLPFVDSIQAVENRGLAGRVNALDLITIGLAYYSVDDFENAARYLEKAAAEDRWLEISGKEVAYLLVGNAYVRWASKENDSQYLTDAAKNYAEALRINPNYGRGLVGQANVLYLEALGPLDHPQIDPAKLDEADALVTQALELEGQPESFNIQSKAHFNRGQIDLARFGAKVPGEDWLALAKDEFLFVTQDYEAGDTTLESLAAHSYFRLGIIAYYQGDPDAGISLVQKAIPMASPFSQGEFTAMLGDMYANLGRKADAAKAYEDAVSIAVSLGDEKRAQKYQDKLNGLNAPPVTPTAAATLPSVPEFGQILSYGGGGGGGSACVGDPLLQTGVYARRWQDGGHVAELCVFDTALPVDTPIRVELTSPDKSVVLKGDIQSPAGGQNVYWLGFENEFNYSYTGDCDEESCPDWGIEFWWPANLPDGDWRVRLSWDAGEVFGTFQTDTHASLPDLSVHDAPVKDALRPSTLLYPCHPVESGEGLMVAGRGFPANAVVYVPVFEQEVSSKYNYLTAQVFTADADGVVYGNLTGNFQAGRKYILGGVTDSTLPSVAPDNSGLVSFGSLKEAADCFYIPGTLADE